MMNGKHENEGRNKNPIIINLIWTFFIFTATITILFERFIFGSYFKTTEDYLFLAGAILGTFLVFKFIGKFLSTKIILIVAIGLAIILSVVLFLVFWNLPLEPSKQGCDFLICSIWGQYIIICTTFSAIPQIIIEISRRAKGSAKYTLKMGSGAIFLVGILLISAGVISLFGYYFVILYSSISMAIMAFIIPFLQFTLNKRMLETEGKHLLADFLLLLRDAMVTVVIVAFGFTMMYVNDLPFDKFISIGTSMAVFGCVYAVTTRFEKQDHPLFILEGNFIALLIASSLTYYLLLLEGAELYLTIGLPEFVIGFAYGYFWTRLIHLSCGIAYPKPFARIPLKKVSKIGANKASFFFYFTFFCILALFQIVPGTNDSLIVYPIGFTISICALLSWAASLWMIRRRMSKKEENSLKN